MLLSHMSRGIFRTLLFFFLSLSTNVNQLTVSRQYEVSGWYKSGVCNRDAVSVLHNVYVCVVHCVKLNELLPFKRVTKSTDCPV